MPQIWCVGLPSGQPRWIGWVRWMNIKRNTCIASHVRLATDLKREETHVGDGNVDTGFAELALASTATSACALTRPLPGYFADLA